MLLNLLIVEIYDTVRTLLAVTKVLRRIIIQDSANSRLNYDQYRNNTAKIIITRKILKIIDLFPLVIS